MRRRTLAAAGVLGVALVVAAVTGFTGATFVVDETLENNGIGAGRWTTTEETADGGSSDSARSAGTNETTTNATTAATTTTTTTNATSTTTTANATSTTATNATSTTTANPARSAPGAG